MILSKDEICHTLNASQHLIPLMYMSVEGLSITTNDIMIKLQAAEVWGFNTHLWVYCLLLSPSVTLEPENPNLIKEEEG